LSKEPHVEIRNRDWQWYQINVAGHRDHQAGLEEGQSQ